MFQSHFIGYMTKSILMTLYPPSWSQRSLGIGQHIHELRTLCDTLTPIGKQVLTKIDLIA